MQLSVTYQNLGKAGKGNFKGKRGVKEHKLLYFPHSLFVLLSVSGYSIALYNLQKLLLSTSFRITFSTHVVD